MLSNKMRSWVNGKLGQVARFVKPGHRVKYIALPCEAPYQWKAKESYAILCFI